MAIGLYFKNIQFYSINDMTREDTNLAQTGVADTL